MEGRLTLKRNSKEFIPQHIMKTIVMIILFMLSVSPFFTAHVEYLVVALILFVVMYSKKKKKLSKDFIYIILFLTILNLANIILFSFFSIRTIMGNYTRFLMPFYAVMIIGREYPEYYVRVIKIFVIISFIFYIPANIIPGFNKQLQNIVRFLGTDPIEQSNFIIYTVEYAKPWESNIPIYRNDGPAGEPGLFVGFLILAMIFETIINNKLWTKNNYLFTAAVISTFSTTGLIVLFILITSYYFMIDRKIKSRIILFPLSLAFAYYVYFNFPFMYEKINEQSNVVYSARSIENIPRDARLPNIVRNLWDSFESPIFGKGRNFETRYSNLSMLSDRAFANNVTNLPAQFGWPFFIYYCFLIIKGFKKLLATQNMKIKYSYSILAMILTLAVSQGFLLTSSFIALLYLNNLDLYVPPTHQDIVSSDFQSNSHLNE